MSDPKWKVDVYSWPLGQTKKLVRTQSFFYESTAQRYYSKFEEICPEDSIKGLKASKPYQSDRENLGKRK